MRIRLSLIALISFAAITAALHGQSIVRSFPTGGTEASGVDYDPSADTIWVSDARSMEISKFSRRGLPMLIRTAPEPRPTGLAIHPAIGNLWISSEFLSVVEMDQTGFSLQNWFVFSMSSLDGVAVDPATSNLFFVQAAPPRRIEEYTGSAWRVGTIDLVGSGCLDPKGLAFNPITRTILIGDGGSGRIIEIDLTGKPLNSWDLSPLGIFPEGLGLDPVAGSVFIVDGAGGTAYEVDGIIQPNPLPPAVDITCNGEDSGVVLLPGASAKIEYSVVASLAAGVSFDVWIVISSPFGFLSYDGIGPVSGWNHGLANAYYTGPLNDFRGTALHRTVPAGAYKAFLGLDRFPNGTIDIAALSFQDSVDFIAH